MTPRSVAWSVAMSRRSFVPFVFALLLAGCNSVVPGFDLAGFGGDLGADLAAGDLAVCDPSRCLQPTAPCLEATCASDGTCAVQLKADGTAVASQTAGDCSKDVCIAGVVTPQPDDTDVPDDHDDCTDDVCSQGAPSNPPKTVNTACGSTGAQRCNGAGACVDCIVAAQCAGSDTECEARTCLGGACGVAFTASGTVVASQTAGDCHKKECDGAGAVTNVVDDTDVNDDSNACTTDACASGVPTHTAVPVDSPCGSTLKCNAIGMCVACTSPSECAAPTNACQVATCSTDGTCGTAPKPDGTTCNDGNACSQTDTCVSGACVGSNPVTCPAPALCHVAGTCNTTTGVCSNPVQLNGATCDDGSKCTSGDVCQNGACKGTAKVCTASDQCHVAGLCAAATGLCGNPMKANGTSCDDSNACTSGDICQAGTCAGPTTVVCTAADQCHVAGTCDPMMGCSTPDATDGTMCNDGPMCGMTETCTAGTCGGSTGTPGVCAAVDQCHGAGACDATGACTSPVLANGTTCDDGNPCTVTDACTQGTCTGGTSPCLNGGTCSSAGAGFSCACPPGFSGTTCETPL